MVANELSELVETISESLAVRGIYLLMDERIDLICGSGSVHDTDNPKVMQKIAEFAAAHEWHVTYYHVGFVFWPDKAMADSTAVASKNHRGA
jgi:hypothetical protein